MNKQQTRNFIKNDTINKFKLQNTLIKEAVSQNKSAKDIIDLIKRIV